MTLPAEIAHAVPAYVYDLAEVRRSVRSLRDQLPGGTRLFYSVKANPHPGVVAELLRQGCDLEVSSTGELRVALEAAADPARVLCTGPGRSAAEVDAALEAGVSTFSVESAGALERLRDRAGRRACDVDVLVRVNQAARVGQGLGMTGGTSQFGVDADLLTSGTWSPADRDLAGLHYYLGSNLVDEAALVAQLCVAVESARAVADGLGMQPRLLDLGGGFPAPFARAGTLPTFPGLRPALETALDAAFPGWRDARPEIWFESGRHLTATCGRLVTRVADVKRSDDRPVVVLESGINHLGGLPGMRRVPPMIPDLVTPDPDRPIWDDALVVGPLCSPLDTWARSATVPALEPGDIVAVPNVGAYGLTASLLGFLSHPAPVEVVVDGDAVVSCSRLEQVRRPVRATEKTRDLALGGLARRK